LGAALTTTVWAAHNLSERHYLRWWGGLAAGIILAQLSPAILRHGPPWVWPRNKTTINRIQTSPTRRAA
jgi:hypothetical protein